MIEQQEQPAKTAHHFKITTIIDSGELWYRCTDCGLDIRSFRSIIECPDCDGDVIVAPQIRR